MKIFCAIICLLILALSQQVVYAQQSQVETASEGESDEDFVELGMPLEEALTKITFSVPSLASGDLVGAIVFEGEGVTRKKDYIKLTIYREDWSPEGVPYKRWSGFYMLLSEYAVESNRYIFVPLAQNGGGSGVFLALNVVDKKTLKSVDSVGLGDRARFKEIILADAASNTVSISYIRREVRKGEITHDPDKTIQKHFRMIEGILREVENPLSPSDPDMMVIPAGDFDMGSRSSDDDAEDDEKPRHTIYLDAFHIDKYEVTNVQYKKFVDANRQWQKDRIPEKYHDGDYLKHWNGNNYPLGKGNHPVVYVSWYAAMAYAEWHGKRLPTEAEWEKAARGDRYGRDYAWGGSLDPNKANYGENIGDTTPIGTYDANGYGLYDMTGNVWEWCLDEYDAGFYSISPSRNPLAGGTVNSILSNWRDVRSVRVLRGGSWVSDAQFIRVSDRTRFTPRITNKARGFRCVKAVTSKTSTKNPDVIFELTEGTQFADGPEVKSIAKADIEALRDLPVYSQKNDYIDEVRLINEKGEQIHVRTCREYESACALGYYPDLPNSNMKNSIRFEQQCGLLNSLQAATIPQQSFVSQPRVGVVDLGLIPFSFFPLFSNDESGDLGATYQSKVKDGVLMVQETNQNSLVIESKLLGMGQHLTEVVRADFNGDGIEDILLFDYRYAVLGTLAYGGILILTKKSIDGKFEIVE